MDADRPATPQLTRVTEVAETSNQIGDFVMEHLRNQGFILAHWQQIREPCWKRRVTKVTLFGPHAGEQVEYLDGAFECECDPTPGFETPHTYSKLMPVHTSDAWISDQLASYYGLDPHTIELERTALLEWVRARNSQGETDAAGS